MNPIAVQARLAVGEAKRHTVAPPHSVLKRIWSSIVSAVIRRNEDDAAERYQGRSWCDSTEHDLNRDIVTGCRRRM